MDTELGSILTEAGAKTGSVMLMDSQAKALRIIAAQGFPEEIVNEVKNLTLASGQGIAGHVYQTGKPYYLRDPKKDALFVHQSIPLGKDFQFLSLPLKNDKGATIGVLNIHFPTEIMLDTQELDHLAAKANRLAAEALKPQ
ncbi:MAG: GAF domain-containing protein [Elusimicrobia bacterium]|nr:GAF domain-containing protein [Elusimicrobiota bacterium]